MKPLVEGKLSAAHQKEKHMSLLNPVQERAYWEVAKNFSFTTDSTKID